MSFYARDVASMRRRPDMSDKRGELLLYRPRQQPQTPVMSAEPTGGREPAAGTASVLINYGGQSFLATREMAECFLVHARQVLDDHDAQLVALLHEGGPELLLIADHIPFQVGDLFQHSPAIETQ